MNHLRKKSAVSKHFGEPYQSMEEMKAGLKADEAGYTEEEIEEIVEGIRERAKEASSAAEPAKDMPKPFPEGLTPEEMAELKAWKKQQKGLKPESSNDLVKAVTDVAPKISRYKDYDVFQGATIKETVSNPFNPERPNVVIRHIQLGERKRMTRIEPAIAHDLNEYGVGQETAMNFGGTSTAEFYFPLGMYTTGSKISFADFAAFQREDMRFAEKYHPKKNISLLVADGYGTAII